MEWTRPVSEVEETFRSHTRERFWSSLGVSGKREKLCCDTVLNCNKSVLKKEANNVITIIFKNVSDFTDQDLLPARKGYAKITN